MVNLTALLGDNKMTLVNLHTENYKFIVDIYVNEQPIGIATEENIYLIENISNMVNWDEVCEYADTTKEGNIENLIKYMVNKYTKNNSTIFEF